MYNFHKVTYFTMSTISAIFTCFTRLTTFTWWSSLVEQCQRGSEASQWTIRCLVFFVAPLLLPAFLHWASLLDHCLLYSTLPIYSESYRKSVHVLDPPTSQDFRASSCSMYARIHVYTYTCMNVYMMCNTHIH